VSTETRLSGHKATWNPVADEKRAERVLAQLEAIDQRLDRLERRQGAG
jgi:hypothetical protein